MHLAVGNACYSVTIGECSSHYLKFDFRFTTCPLQQLLHQPFPVSVILRKLEVLAVRFKNPYLTLEADWSRQFDINMVLLAGLIQDTVIESETKDI